MILIELTAAVDMAGTLRTFYVGDAQFATRPGDTPPHQAFDPSVIDPGSIGIHAFGDGRTGGGTRLETGEIVLDNTDGQYDEWVKYSFDGRQVVIRTGKGGVYPSDFATLLVATVEKTGTPPGQFVLYLRDKQLLFDQPVLTSTYGGTNILPTGLDGLATDLKGKQRPRALGQVFNVMPPQVNTARLIFEVGVCNSVDAVYSNGAALTADSNYTSQAEMETNAPAAGHYRAWPAGGYFRIGSYSSEQITADVTQGSASANRTVGQIIKQLALSSGVTGGEISDADVEALDALSSAQVGIWLDDDTTVASAMDQVAASIGAWYGFDQTGVLRMGQLSEPAGAPALTLHDYDILGLPERRAPTDNGRPVWRVTVNHTRCYTVQTSGLAGAAARPTFVGKERRSVNSANAGIKLQWLLADEMSIDTLLVSELAAQTEANRLLAMQSQRRDVFDVPIDIGVFAAAPLRMMVVVEVFLGRFDMAAGRRFRLIGISFNLAGSTATLSLWG
jgi:hypothetical protein